MQRVLSVLTVCIALLATSLSARAQERLNVVATFSILGDFARNVGGDRVNVTTLVGPNSDTHVYTPSPSDAKKITDAKLVIVNGLGLEGWLPRLIKSSGGTAATVVATKGIKTRRIEAGDASAHDHDHGQNSEDADPHAWQSVANAKIYVANIRDGLIAADATGADVYRSNATAYLAKLDALDRDVREAVAKIRAERRNVISTHAAFGYFAAAYGVKFIAPQGVSTELSPAPATSRPLSPRSKSRKFRLFFSKMSVIRG